MTDATPEPTSPPAEIATTSQRPTVVTAAVVIAFLLAVYEVLTALVLFTDAQIAAGPSVVWYVFAVVHLVLAALLAWGGWAALTAGNDRILVMTSLAVVVVLVVKTILEIVFGILPVGWLILILYATMYWLLTRPASKEYFAQKSANAAP
jgi:hypothetical protein